MPREAFRVGAHARQSRLPEGRIASTGDLSLPALSVQAQATGSAARVKTRLALPCDSIGGQKCTRAAAEATRVLVRVCICPRPAHRAHGRAQRRRGMRPFKRLRHMKLHVGVAPSAGAPECPRSGRKCARAAKMRTGRGGSCACVPAHFLREWFTQVISPARHFCREGREKSRQRVNKTGRKRLGPRRLVLWRSSPTRFCPHRGARRENARCALQS